MPDLDLIKQAKQGDARVQKRPIPSLSSEPTETATSAGGLLLICCRSSKRVTYRFNEWL